MIPAMAKYTPALMRDVVSFYSLLHIANVIILTVPIETPERASPVMRAMVYLPGSNPTSPKRLVWRMPMATPMRATHMRARTKPTSSAKRAEVRGIMTKRTVSRIRLEETLQLIEQKALK